MMEPTNPAAFTPTGSSSTSGQIGMGRDDFMTLLLTQLQHQDPLNPMQPHEFAAQLADFSSVEQLSQIQQDMGYQLQSLQLTAALSKTTFSAALLGRSVLAEGNQVTIPEEGSGQIQVEVGDGGGDAVLKLLDSDGHEVASRELGHVDAGRQTLDLPDDLPPGTYTYKLEVSDGDGESVSVKTFTAGVVSRVLFEPGGIVLQIGDMKVSLDSLVEIAPADSDQA